MNRWKVLVVQILSLAGMLDSLYLTVEHISGRIPPCTVGQLFNDCGTVLSSSYAVVFGVPLALIGLIFYFAEFTSLSFATRYRWATRGALIFSFGGFVGSLYFVYLQAIVLHAFCRYCMLSALISFVLFIAIHILFAKDRKLFIADTISYLYTHLLKRVFFLLDPEFVHVSMLKTGSSIVPVPLVKQLTSFAFQSTDSRLSQDLYGIHFSNPVGLAAGFDYEADLTGTLAPLGFGFQSVGTITNLAYGGNPKPRLGRLAQSQSLMVNKGYKNLGAGKTIKKIHHKNFSIPVGISIGKSNRKEVFTQRKAITDIIAAFEKFEISDVRNSYYELNISCPNLYGDVSFYPKKNLDELLKAVDATILTKPLFVKMPISESDDDVRSMLEVITNHNVQGIIIGNLSKDRSNPALKKEEVTKFKDGNFSGKATWDRSNELISLAFNDLHGRLPIIGCGGIFTPEDAYEKILRGATLLQLITGMIFQGPSLPSKIVLTLPELLARDGFNHLSEAIGKKPKK